MCVGVLCTCLHVVCMYVCMYVCACLCVCMCMHVYLHVCVCTGMAIGSINVCIPYLRPSQGCVEVSKSSHDSSPANIADSEMRAVGTGVCVLGWCGERLSLVSQSPAVPSLEGEGQAIPCS